MADKKKYQLVIIGGGPSMREGIELGLWEKLKYKFTIGTNFSYRYYTPTILVFTDRDFYEIGSCTFTGEEVLEHRNAMARVPCIIGNAHRNLPVFDNTVLVPSSSKYNRDITTGIYTSWLSGVFALTLGIWALDYNDRENLDIYMLGMDFGEKRKEKVNEKLNMMQLKQASELDEKGEVLSHFYGRDIVHGGTSKIDHFCIEDKARKVYLPYKSEDKVKIYNVCPTSKIPGDIIPKITYKEFFERLDAPSIWHLDWIKEIVPRLKEIFG